MTHQNQEQQQTGSGRESSGAFTLVELLVVIMVIAILASLLLPAVSHGKTEAKRAACRSNQGQLVKALMMYADSDSKQSFGGTDERRKFYPFIDENWLRKFEKLPVKIFFCPATRNGDMAEKHHRISDDIYSDLVTPATDSTKLGGFSYDFLLWFADQEDYWNGNPDSNQNSRFVIKTQSNTGSYAHANEAFDMKGKRFGPSGVWLLTDNAAISWNRDIFWPVEGRNHGAAGANTAFVDGHVEWIPRQDYIYKYEASQDNNRTRATPRPSL